MMSQDEIDRRRAIKKRAQDEVSFVLDEASRMPDVSIADVSWDELNQVSVITVDGVKFNVRVSRRREQG